jgi:deazaflavin-dependent oxidoreductase (nitroreductase family)
MNEWEERNRRVIEEFRASRDKIGGPLEGRPMLLLTHTGRKSGRRRTTPLVYLEDDGRVYVVGSKGGAPTHPDWYDNLVANPRVTVEIGTEKYEADAKVVTGPERDRLYAKLVDRMPFFGDYQKKTTRVIPVVELVRAG